jgi:glycine cleavage system H protein
MQYPDDRKYAESHEWAKLGEDNQVRMGISDFAQDALGDVVYVELPDIGADVVAGQPCSEVESTKSVSDVNSPVSGTIVAVNEALDTNPELVNSDPYGEGWFAVIEASAPTDIDALLTAEAYKASVS